MVLDSLSFDTLASPLDGPSPDSTGCFGGAGSESLSFPTHDLMKRRAATRLPAPGAEPQAERPRGFDRPFAGESRMTGGEGRYILAN
jgi:hypothetical protein